MTVSEIIKIACDFTGNEELASMLDNGEKSFSSGQQKTIDTLVKCLNLVQNEIATDYIPLVAFEDVVATEFKVDYSKFAHKPIAVIWAKDRFGRNLRFKALPEYLMLFASKAKIKYNYLPQQITSIDQTLPQSIVPMRIYAYGVAREYFLMQNLSDDADIWEVRFKDSLFLFARKKHEVKMPCRRWI